MVELVDTLDLGSSAARRGGSTPFTRTITKRLIFNPRSVHQYTFFLYRFKILDLCQP